LHGRVIKTLQPCGSASPLQCTAHAAPLGAFHYPDGPDCRAESR
jgi:hypothetical protein